MYGGPLIKVVHVVNKKLEGCKEDEFRKGGCEENWKWGTPERDKEDKLQGICFFYLGGGVRGKRGVKKEKCGWGCEKMGGGVMPDRGKEDKMRGKGCEKI